MKINKVIISLTILIGIISCTPKKKPVNVLLLYMDDLRPELGCYGSKVINSPNIDALANRGVQFNNAYCNVAVCGASRASMLTGMRPTKSKFRDYKTFVQVDAPESITLPQVFKRNGYTTISNGKIYHHLDDRMSDWDEVYRPYAFDQNPEGLTPSEWWESLWRDYKLPENKQVYIKSNRGPAFENANVNDSAYIDGIMTEKVLKDLEKLKKEGKPFLLTAGFISPHLPFNAPAKYWDKYDQDSIHQPYNNFIPENAPAISISESNELRQYTDIPPLGEQVSDETAISLIHAYYATVSYVDALVGRILYKLKELELDKNTIVVLVSDHGYNLQEHTQWCKWTNHRTSMQVPLIIVSPFNKNIGKTNALVELVDIYPTLIEMCGLKAPLNQIEGSSMLPILHNLNSKGKDQIFINNQNGYTVKTKRFCYTEFIDPKDNGLIATTLYDHENDPDENVNISEADSCRLIVEHLHELLHTKYQSNLSGK